MARSTSSTSSVASNVMDRGKHIETGLVDFVPHPPSRLDAYAYLEEPMEMTLGRFHFRVGKEGSHRLEVPFSSGSSASDSDLSDSSSSFEMGVEEISPPRFVKTATSEKLAKIFGSMSFESSADSNISSDSDSVDSFDFIDKSTSVREVFTDIYDGVTNPNEGQTSKYHQIYVIGEASRPQEETSEAFDDAGNPYIDPADLMREKILPPTIEYLNWSGKDIGFTIADHPQQVPRPGQSALILPTIGKNVQVYIDDVVITTKQGSTLIEDLKETFDNLDKFCLKLNPTKCSFGVPAGELLGFLVSARGIEANPEKIQAIVTMRKPTKLKEIQQLTGRVAALKRFVTRLGEKALPFYALIKQGEKFEWNEEEDRSFEDLKRTISTPPILVAPKESNISCYISQPRLRWLAQ
ncbi:hypothetical protein QYE76_005198 [Lolium multiflorum]|uniref:Reverse transcriptase domain-containing protein n=1 Tax=Lolium multiflorum TaxID=4521 RepID=A0AAD8RS70_LOLMU|nr:hypothetical protein QYE76_005198 [Lolium multiflorum]